MVTIAVRVRPPPAEDGATISPTSASLRSTVPSNGARTLVYSRFASATLSCAWAVLSPATSASTRVCAFSRSTADSTCCSRSARARSKSRRAWARSTVSRPTSALAASTAAA